MNTTQVTHWPAVQPYGAPRASFDGDYGSYRGAEGDPRNPEPDDDTPTEEMLAEHAAKTFTFDGSEPATFGEMLEANAHDEGTCEFLCTAEVGDVFMGCERVS